MSKATGINTLQRKINYQTGDQNSRQTDLAYYHKDLTPKQKRRIKHKENRRLQSEGNPTLHSRWVRGRKILQKAWRVSIGRKGDGCPTCNQIGDSPCLTAKGNVTRKPHAGRYAG